MSTFEPRALPEHAYRSWFKNGARIVARSWDVWMPLMFVMACFGNAMAQVLPMTTCLFLGAISGVVHGFNAAAAERYARRERFGWLGLIACWAAEWQAFGPLLRRSVLVRAIGGIAFVLFLGYLTMHQAGAAVVDTSTTGGEHTASSSALPLWFTFFVPWNSVWFFSLLLQAGGPLSMHYWLMTRCGVDRAGAGRLWHQAFVKNLKSFFVLMAAVMVLMIVSSFLPFLTVPIDCFWTAVVFCAWNDLFMGKGEIEQQEAVATASRMASSTA